MVLAAFLKIGRFRSYSYAFSLSACPTHERKRELDKSGQTATILAMECPRILREGGVVSECKAEFGRFRRRMLRIGERWLLRRDEERTGRLAADARAEEEISRAERPNRAWRNSRRNFAGCAGNRASLSVLKSPHDPIGHSAIKCPAPCVDAGRPQTPLPAIDQSTICLPNSKSQTRRQQRGKPGRRS